MTDSAVEPPRGLADRGLRFWTAATDGFELNLDERELLVEVARHLDLADALAAAVEADGLMVSGAEGQPRVHPAVQQLTQARQAIGRMLAQLGLPGDDDEPAVVSPQTARARKAASVRWALQREKESRPVGGRRGA